MDTNKQVATSYTVFLNVTYHFVGQLKYTITVGLAAIAYHSRL